MSPQQTNLNHIWLHGNEEEKEAVRLVFLELVQELSHPEAVQTRSAELDISHLTEWLDWLSSRWSSQQETFITQFLESLKQDIQSRRERDITLI